MLTTTNPQVEKDNALFLKLGISPEQNQGYSDEVHQAAIMQALSEQVHNNISTNIS